MCWVSPACADCDPVVVSVAGCLGYDVLVKIRSQKSNITLFQLLVV